MSWWRRGGDKSIENISFPALKKGDDCFLVISEYVSHWETETHRGSKYGDGQYEYRGQKYKHLHKEAYQEFSAWYCAHGSKVDPLSVSIALRRRVIEVDRPEGKICEIDFDPLRVEVEIITKSIVELDSNISVADATSELCKRYNASGGQLSVKHHSQYRLLEWSGGPLEEQLRQFQSKTICFEKSDITKLGRGLCGLQNLGNTCFMNSALQCLSSTEPLRDVFLKEEYRTYINVSNPLGMQGQIASTFGNLMNDMWRQDNRVIAPRDLKKLIGKFAPQFSGNHQQDAHELLLFMLDGLHEDLKNTDDPMDVPVDPETAVGAWITHQVENRSRIMEIFHGQTQVVLKCHECHKTDSIFDPFSFLTLQLPMETNATVTDVTTFTSNPTVTVTLVNLYNIKKKHMIEGSRFTTAQALKRRIESKIGVPKTEIILVEVKDYKIKRVLSESDCVPEQVHAYQFKAKREQRLVLVNLLGNNKKGLCDPMILSLPTQFKAVDVTHALMEKLKFTLPEGHTIAHDDWPHKQPIVATEGASQHVKRAEYSAAEATMSTDTHPAKQYERQSVFGNEGVGMDVYTPAPSSFTPRKLEQNTEVVMPLPPSKLYPSEDSVTIPGVTVYNSVWGPDMKKYISSLPKEALQSQPAPHKARDITLHDCINIFTGSKKYTKSDNWYCQYCSQVARGERTCKLKVLPDVLIIHLKRFTSPRNKINYHVDFPIRGLDMSKYMAKSDIEGPAPVYDLFAVCNHAGRMASGHYTAYTKRPSSNGQEEWYIFDDTSVGKIDEKEVEKEVVNTNAYILFYMRRSKTKSSA